MATPSHLSKSRIRFPIASENRDLLFALLGWDGSIETVTSGALSVTKKTSLIGITDTKAYTLAAGSFEGQRKRVIVSAVSGSPAGTLTVVGPTTTFTFSAVGECLELEYHAANGWTLVGASVAATDLTTLATILGYAGTIETKTSGALSATARTSLLSVTGTQTFTLAAGTFEGQRKTVKVTVAATTPAGTLTVTGPVATFLFNAVGQGVELEYHTADGWTEVEPSERLGVVTAVPDTVTSGAISVLTRSTKVSVTGTVGFTLAAGYEGQRKSLRCTVAATSPDGTLTLTSPDCSTITLDAVGAQVELEYHATGGWHVVSATGATLNA